MKRKLTLLLVLAMTLCLTIVLLSCGKSNSETNQQTYECVHNGVLIPGTSPTCTKKGFSDEEMCTLCGEILVSKTEIPPLGHTEEILPAVEPTCTEEGLTEGKKCSVCDEIIIKQQIIPSLHIEEIIPAKESTCTETGLSEGKKCSVCEEILVEQEIISEKHTYENKICTACGQNQPSEGLRFSLDSETDTYTLMGIGSCTDTEIVIPSKYNNKYVTSIARKAFEGQTKFTSIVIPDSVTSIEMRAFYGCTGLTSVTMGDGVTSIGDSAFSDCTGLTSISIGNGVTSIGDYAFSYCIGLTSITIPESLTNIGRHVFYGCLYINEVNFNAVALSGTYLLYSGDFQTGECPGKKGDGITLTIGKNVTTISDYMFSNSEYITNVVFEEGSACESIESDAFKNCKNLASITIPDSVTSIGENAFYRCTRLTTITIPDSVKSIGYHAFDGCSNLTSVRIGNSVTEIGQNAFRSCNNLENVYISDIANWCNIKFVNYYSNPMSIAENIYFKENLLTKIVIPDGITSIGAYTFQGCNSLTSITIPYSVTSIEADAFLDCKNLIVIYCEAGNRLGDWATNWNTIGFNSTVPVVWNCENNDIANDGYVYTIVKGIYYGIKNKTAIVVGQSINIKEVNIPNSIEFKGQDYPVTSIGYDAFKHATSLTSVTIPDSVTKIAGNVFRNAISLEYIVVDENNTEYKSIDGNLYTKDGKTLIRYAREKENTSFEIPDSVTSINEYAFYYCDNLTSITIPNSVTAFGDNAFYGCENLTNVNYLGKIEEWCNISYSDYYRSPLCYAKNLYINGELLTNLVIPDTITEIKAYAFYGCDSLTSIVIPESVKSIGEFAFSRCDKLTRIIIPNSVTSIQKGTFEDCKSLTSIDISDDTISIGDRAFSGCSSLTDIVIPDGVKSIGDFAFSGCDSLTDIVIPEGVTSIGAYAFYGCDSLTTVTILDNVMSIEHYAFGYCYNLTKVTISNNVTSIGRDVFKDSNCLTIYCEEAMQPSGWDSDWNSASSPVVWDCNNNVVADDGNIYEIIDGIRYAIKDNEAEVAGQSRNIKEANIPNSITYKGQEYPITSISDNAFSCCKYLTSVMIGDSVTSIGDSAFSGCDKLASIIIPNSVTIIGYEVFYYCTGLTSVTIPDSVTSIGSLLSNYECITLYCESTWETCIWIKEWGGVPGYPIVWDCKNNDVADNGGYIYTVIDGIRYAIKDNEAKVARQSKNIKEASIPSSINYKGQEYPVTSINDCAFSDCTDLTSIVISEGVTSIGNSAFSGCKNLTNIVIPKGVTSIGNSAFLNCTSLTSIIIPESVTSIGNSVFSNCTSLTSIIIPESVTSIGEFAFNWCRSLIIYCELINEPREWFFGWNDSNCPVYWYSETEPTSQGNYWHYVDGVVTIWE